jgi:hypothetical protein
MDENKRVMLRRALLGLGAGVAAAATFGRPAKAQGAEWRPAMEKQDAWMDAIGGRHRMVFDTISQDGAARALTFCASYYNANKNDYDIPASELGVLMIFRSGSTPYGFNDAFWAKYSAGLDRFTDPTTKAAPIVNIYNSAEKAPMVHTNGLTLDALAKMGGHIAVCSIASRGLAATLAPKANTTADAVFAEMGSSLVAGARMVPAGTVALNRAQERRFSVCYTA